jgi:transcription initiation factor TFIIIB Brf1 subunit/transcription initiation factor TFIIB
VSASSPTAVREVIPDATQCECGGYIVEGDVDRYCGDCGRVYTVAPVTMPMGPFEPTQTAVMYPGRDHQTKIGWRNRDAMGNPTRDFHRLRYVARTICDGPERRYASLVSNILQFHSRTGFPDHILTETKRLAKQVIDDPNHRWRRSFDLLAQSLYFTTCRTHGIHISAAQFCQRMGLPAKNKIVLLNAVRELHRTFGIGPTAPTTVTDVVRFSLVGRPVPSNVRERALEMARVVDANGTKHGFTHSVAAGIIYRAAIESGHKLSEGTVAKWLGVSEVSLRSWKDYPQMGQ